MCFSVLWNNQTKSKGMMNWLDALQDFHQLSLLVWSHASEHSSSQSKLQRPHVEKKKLLQNLNTDLNYAVSHRVTLTTNKNPVRQCCHINMQRSVCTFCMRWGKCSMRTAKAFPLMAKWYFCPCWAICLSYSSSCSRFISTVWGRSTSRSAPENKWCLKRLRAQCNKITEVVNKH